MATGDKLVNLDDLKVAYDKQQEDTNGLKSAIMPNVLNLVGNVPGEYYPVSFHIGDKLTVATHDGLPATVTGPTLFFLDENKQSLADPSAIIAGNVSRTFTIDSTLANTRYLYISNSAAANRPLMCTLTPFPVPYRPYIGTEETMKASIDSLETGLSAVESDLLNFELDVKNEIGKWVQADFTIVEGYYTAIYPDDPPQQLSNYYCTRYAVNPGQKLLISASVQANSNLALVLFYNASGEYVSKYKPGESSLITYIDEPVTVPAGCYYITVTSYHSSTAGIDPAIKIIELTSDNIWDYIDTNGNKGLACKLDNTAHSATIGFKYSNSKDGRIIFKQVGINNLFQFYELWFKDNSGVGIDTDFTSNGTRFIQAYSDWVGPYGDVLVVNNPDGDVSGVLFTGGWHGTNNQEGHPTAENISYKVFVDNKQITDEEVYGCDIVKIVVVNKIQAANTVKEDETGRNVLQETVTYTIDPSGRIAVDVKTEILEALSIRIYYGLQASSTQVWNKILFVNDENDTKWITPILNTEVDGSAKENGIVNNVFLKDGNGNCFECYIDPNYGLGKRNALDTGSFTAFHATNNKVYMHLLGNTAKNFESGVVLCWRGGYRFYME